MKKILCIFCAILMLACTSEKKKIVDFESKLDAHQEAVFLHVMGDVNERILDENRGKIEKIPTSELVTIFAEQLLGTRYVSYTLEQEPEDLRVYLDSTDCILFVELCSCLAYTAKGIMLTPDSYDKGYEPNSALLCNNIQQMRYRGGIIDGYASRVHYTSEWIKQNEARGIMKEISYKFGEEYDEPFFFMSSHPEYYKQLQNDSLQMARIIDTEKRLTDAKPYYFVPQTSLQNPDIISQIKTGDIVAFMDTHDGLDLAHVALAYESNNEMHFIHASYRAKRVIIEEKTLADYADNGIRIVRFVK